MIRLLYIKMPPNATQEDYAKIEKLGAVASKLYKMHYIDANDAHKFGEYQLYTLAQVERAHKAKMERIIDREFRRESVKKNSTTEVKKHVKNKRNVYN